MSGGCGMGCLQLSCVRKEVPRNGPCHLPRLLLTHEPFGLGRRAQQVCKAGHHAQLLPWRHARGRARQLAHRQASLCLLRLAAALALAARLAAVA